LFHIQTEDSGIRHPHIITHLFADGGRILKTTKTSYAEHVGEPSMAETVRGMMKEQHKAMFIALRDGQLDYLFDENAAPPPGAVSPPEPSKSGRGSPPSTPETSAAKAPQAAPAPARPLSPEAALRPKAAGITPPPRPAVAATAAAVKPAAASASPGPAPRPPAAEPAPSSKRSSSRPRLEIEPLSPPNAGRKPGTSTGRGARSPAEVDSEPSIDLDLDALERAAAEAQTPFFQQIQDLPPPPASVIGRRAEAAASGAGVYSNVHPETPVIVPPPVTAEQIPSNVGSGRYAPSRPASIFATNRPAEGASIFGEDLISEKSLDEVILSYLAEDLDIPPEKK
jgi:hypothetical protein